MRGGASSLEVISTEMGVKVLKQKTYGSPSNGITKLYAQLLAAKLNIASGASDTDIATAIVDADAFLAANDWSAWSGLDAATKSWILDLKDVFDEYNNGITGPGHCD